MATGSSDDSTSQESFSMRMVTYGIQKKFHRVRHLTCAEFQKMVTEDSSNMSVLVSYQCKWVEKWVEQHQ